MAISKKEATKKRDLVNNLAKKLGATRSDTRILMDAVFQVVYDELCQDMNVDIGIGVFTIRTAKRCSVYSNSQKKQIIVENIPSVGFRLYTKFKRELRVKLYKKRGNDTSLVKENRIAARIQK